MTQQNSLLQLPWIEKYRPKNLDQIIDHQEKIEVLRKLISNHELPHLLFYGVPGTGKTSLILAAAREMYGKDYRQYILELNASEQRGIDMVRTTIPEFVRAKSDKLRLVILDEADSMTYEGQSCLRRVMENYVKNSRFCLICNNITRIIPGLQSRCARMRFGKLESQEIYKKVTHIIESEQVKIEPKAIDVLIELNSDLRQVLNTLQCLHYIKSDAIITEDDIYEYIGRPKKSEVDKFYSLLFKGFHKAYAPTVEILRQNRWNLLDMITEICKKVINDHKIDDPRRARILISLSEIEYRVINGRDSELQLASLIAAFN